MALARATHHAVQRHQCTQTVTPPPAATNAATAPSLVIEYVVPAPAATYAALQVVVPEIPEISVVEKIQEQIVETIEVLPQEQSAVTGSVNPQFSTSDVEAPQVVDSFPLSDDFAAPMYNQVHQEQIVATVQLDVIFQEIPVVHVVERIQEQIVEPIEVLPQERVQLHTAIQNFARASPSNPGAESRHRFGELTSFYHCC